MTSILWISWLLLIDMTSGTYRYNTFSSTPSPIETVTHLVKELHKEVSDIRKEMKTKMEVIKYEINCEIKNLRDELIKDRRFDGGGDSRPSDYQEVQSLKRKINKSLKNVADQSGQIKNELRSQKAEMYAIRNGIRDSREDLMESGNIIMKGLLNTNATFMCYLKDLRMQLFKINSNFAMIKRDQERVKDLIVMTQISDKDDPLLTTEPPTEDPYKSEKVPGCASNPLETQETLKTFGSRPVFDNFSVIARGRGYGRYTTPRPSTTPSRDKTRGRSGVESLFPTHPETCLDPKKVFLEFPPMPRDCRDAMDLGFMESGIYRIEPPGLKPNEVLCEQAILNGGWTVIVIRRKVPKHIGFNRTWTEYEEGFGDPTREYWIGLKTLHALTRQQPHEIRAELEDWEGNTAWASYSYFTVSGPEDKYRLRVSGYTGNAGDSMRHSHLQMFSTIDQDNDQEDWGSCARGRGGGGWWWGRCACTQPTGQYRRGKYPGPEKGITWWHWKDSNYSLKTLILMIRPKNEF